MSDYLYDSNQRTDYDDNMELDYQKYVDGIEAEESDNESDKTEQEINKQKGIKKIFKAVGAALKGKIEEKLIIILYVMTVIRLISDIVRFFIGAVTVNFNAVPGSFVYYFFAIAVPFGTWIYSTRNKFKKFSYTFTKMAGLFIGILSLCAVILDVVFLCCCIFIVPLVLRIPISQDITASMITSLAMILVMVPPLVFFFAVLKSSIDIIKRKETVALIERFMVDRNVDTRKDKANAYDYGVARNMKTGKIYNVAEGVRKMHMLVLGPTGAGKTSMAFTTAIAQDLDKRTENETRLKKNMERMLNEKKVVLTRDISDKEFDTKYFRPISEASKKEIKKVIKESPMCGMTLVAPTASFGDEIYELCKNRGITKINRVDPVLDKATGKHKEGFIGFNPFYINPDISEFDKRIELINKARIFADVLQMIYEAGGSVDTYFSGLNKQITSCMCTLIMKAYPILHEKYPDKYPREQACPQQFLDVINDFSLAKDYVEVMNEYIRNHPDERLDYENKIKRIEYDLLGDGAKNMREQARGLVNIISDILANPLIRDVLCAENSMDLDKSLSENYVTIVNYELSMGESDSKGFGDFFLLSFQTAVFRRPKNNRPMHMLYVDEFPVLLHPSMEKMFSLYRQFGVCVAVAVQTLSQFDRQASTKFMKNVVLNNARTHIVYGGLGPEEMEYYEKLGGKDFSVMVQDTTSETALSLEETQQSESSRSSITTDNTFTGRQLRYKDFQQATMITIDEKGNAMDAFPIRFDFIDDEGVKGLQPYRVNWHQYFEQESADGTEVINDSGKNVNASDIMKNVQTSMAAMVNVSNGYQMKNEDILDDTLTGFDVKKGATVIHSELTMQDQIDRIRKDIEQKDSRESIEKDADGAAAIAEKAADIQVKTQSSASANLRSSVMGISSILDFDFDVVGDVPQEAVERPADATAKDSDSKNGNADGNVIKEEASSGSVDVDELMNKLKNL